MKTRFLVCVVSSVVLLLCSCSIVRPASPEAGPSTTPYFSTPRSEWTQSPAPTAVLPGVTPVEGPAELTWVATEISKGYPHEGWVDYIVRLAIENRSSEFLSSRGLMSVAVQTEDGYSYQGEWRPREHVRVDNEFPCKWPDDVWGVEFIPGPIPPGFRISGTIGYDPDRHEICATKPRVSFSIGETLRPSSLTVGYAEWGGVDLQEGVGEPAYPLVDSGQRFDALPGIIEIGNLSVTITGGATDPSGGTIFFLAYENRDPGTNQYYYYNPISAVIDSRGIIHQPGLGGYIQVCKSTFPGNNEQLGPLQQARYQACVNWDAEGPVYPIYLVAHGHTGSRLDGTFEDHYYVYEIGGY